MVQKNAVRLNWHLAYSGKATLEIKKHEKRWSRKEGLTPIGDQHLTRGGKVRQDAQKSPQERRTKFVPTKYRAAAPNIIATTTTQRRDQTSPATLGKKYLLSPTPKIRFLLPPPPPSSIETDLFLPLLACLAFPPFIFQLGKYRMTKDRRDQKNLLLGRSGGLLRKKERK